MRSVVSQRGGFRSRSLVRDPCNSAECRALRGEFNGGAGLDDGFDRALLDRAQHGRSLFLVEMLRDVTFVTKRAGTSGCPVLATTRSEMAMPVSSMPSSRQAFLA